MSQGSAASVVIDRDGWDQVLAQLRADGFSPIESIKVTRAVLHVGLGEAKVIVHNSRAWADAQEAFERVHDAVETSLSDLGS